MLTPQQFRAKAAEYGELVKRASNPDAIHEFQELERSFIELANNAAWLASNLDKTVDPTENDSGPYAGLAKKRGSLGIEELAGLAQNEEHVLHRLGAAVIMRWNALPKKLQKELFDAASSIGDLPQTAVLRGQIARFLHKHKDDEAGPGTSASSRRSRPRR